MAGISAVNPVKQSVNLSISTPESGWKTLKISITSITRHDGQEIVRTEVTQHLERDTVQMLVNELSGALLR